MLRSNNKRHRQGELAADFISRLPDALLHKILALLPTRSATITSILSKRWAKLWSSFPIVDLDERNFSNRNFLVQRQNFLVSLNSCLRHRELRNLDKLRLRIFFPSEPKIYKHLDQFLGLAMRGHVKELELNFSGWAYLHHIEEFYGERTCYILPEVIFSCASSLTSLKIEGCQLEGFTSFNLPSLKVLVIKDVVTNEESFRGLISGCPLIETLVLKCCHEVKAIRVFHSKVKCLTLKPCGQTKKLELNLPSLMHMKYKGPYRIEDNTRIRIYKAVDLSTANKIPILQSLIVKYTIMDTETFQNIFHAFQDIQKMQLKYCGIQGIEEVSQRSVRTLVVRDCAFQTGLNTAGGTITTVILWKNLRCNPMIDDKDFKYLKRILLEHIEVRDRVLKFNDSSCPNLEDLSLISCIGLQDLVVKGTKLKSLVVIDCLDLRNCYIRAISLLSLEYTGRPTGFSLLLGSSQLNVRLHFNEPNDYQMHRELDRIRNFLLKLRHATAITMRIDAATTKAIVMFGHLNSNPLDFVPPLEVHTTVPENTSHIEVLCGILRISNCHQSLSIVIFSLRISLQFQEIDRTMLPGSGNSVRTTHGYVWDHLVEISLSNFRGGAEETSVVEFLLENTRKLRSLFISLANEGELSIQTKFVADLLRNHSQVLENFKIVYIPGNSLSFTKLENL